MNTTLRLFATSLMLCLLAACNRDGLQLPGAVEEAQDDNREATDPYVVSGDAGKVGAAIDEHGDITEPKTVFAPNDTVYVSVPSKGKRLGSRIEVFWFHSDGLSRKNEQKQIAGQFTAFEFKPTDPGKYNIEIDVDNRPIGLTEFEVK